MNDYTSGKGKGENRRVELFLKSYDNSFGSGDMESERLRLKRGLLGGLFASLARVILNLLKYKWLKSYYLLPPHPYLPQVDGDPTQWLVQTAIIDLIVGLLFGLLYGLLRNALPGTGVKKGIGYGLVIWIISELPCLLIASMTGMVEMSLLVVGGIAGLLSSLVIGIGIVLIYEAGLKQKAKGVESREKSKP